MLFIILFLTERPLNEVKSRLPTSQVYTFLFTCVSSLLFHFITTFLLSLSLFISCTHTDIEQLKAYWTRPISAPSLFYTDPSWHFFVNKIKGAPKTPKTPEKKCKRKWLIMKHRSQWLIKCETYHRRLTPSPTPPWASLYRVWHSGTIKRFL